jgi:predicted transcriptional regulator
VTQSIDVHVEGGAEAIAQRFVAAWHRAERGEPVDEHHLPFESWEGLAWVLDGPRLELLRHLHRHPTVDVGALARVLGRDPMQVAADAEALTEAGLIDRSKAGLRADYSEIRARIAV